MTRLSDGEIERLMVTVVSYKDLPVGSEYALAHKEGALLTLLDHAPALLSELQSLRAANEWRAGMENAPRDGTRILARYMWNGRDHYLIIQHHEQFSWWVAGSTVVHDDTRECHRNRNFTHWKPITPPDETNTDILASMREREARLVEALEWYAERASSLAAMEMTKNPDYALAIFTELSLDAGNRASKALQESEGA